MIEHISWCNQNKMSQIVDQLFYELDNEFEENLPRVLYAPHVPFDDEKSITEKEEIYVNTLPVEEGFAKVSKHYNLIKPNLPPQSSFLPISPINGRILSSSPSSSPKIKSQNQKNNYYNFDDVDSNHNEYNEYNHSLNPKEVEYFKRKSYRKNKNNINNNINDEEQINIMQVEDEATQHTQHTLMSKNSRYDPNVTVKVKGTKDIIKLKTVRGPGGSTNFNKACDIGWTLSKGWNKRPHLTEVDNKVVKENITRWAYKQDYARLSRKKGYGLGASNRINPHQWIQSVNTKPGKLNAVTEDKCAPGARYNTRQNYAGKKYNVTWEKPPSIKNTTAKDITFGNPKRISNSIIYNDKYPQLERPRSPGPIYTPKDDLTRYTRPITPNLSTAGRTFDKSIYFELMNAEGPGPAYNTTNGFKKTSNVNTCSGLNMGNIIKNDSKIIDKRMDRSFNVHVLRPWLVRHDNRTTTS